MKTHIEKVKIARNRHGTVYYYDRVTGHRIHGEYGSEEFMANLVALRSGKAVTLRPDQVTTLGQLIETYKRSSAFIVLEERTRADYHKQLDYLKPLADIPLSSFNAPLVSKIKQEAFEKRARSWANKIVTMISILFNFGIEPGYTSSNPADGVAKIKKPTSTPDANRPWKDHELDLVLRTIKPSLKAAVALGAYIGLREGDTVALPVSALVGDTLTIRQNKTGHPIEVPVHSELMPYLKVALAQKNRSATTIVVGDRGRTLGVSGFRSMFFAHIRVLKEKGLIEPGLTFHGLRHTVGTRLAEAGASDAVIQALLGHLTPAQAQVYRRAAAQKSGAKIAMGLLEKRTKEE